MPGTISVDGFNVPVGAHEGRKIIIGADHRGLELKNRIVSWLLFMNCNVTDVGTFSGERCDHPVIAGEIARQVSQDPAGTVGIGVCGSGIGMGMAASKQPGVYPARCVTPDDAVHSRKHDTANFLALGADVTDFEMAIKIVRAWLTTPFYSDPGSEKRYMDRFVQIVKMESANIG
jgi:RpiB/LacA/LacB family sugar-phosphate isomerase